MNKLQFIEKLTAFIFRRHGTVLVVGLLLTVASVAITVKRFKVATNLAALLPEKTNSSTDYEYVKRRFGSPEYMEIILGVKGDGKIRQKNIELAKKYLPTLDAKIQSLTDYVDFTITRFPLTFVKQAYLMNQSVASLKKLQKCLSDLKERSLLGLDDDDEWSEKDEKDCLTDNKPGGTGEQNGSLGELPQEYFISKLGYLCFFVRPTKPSSMISWNRKAQRTIIAELSQTIQKHPGMNAVFKTPIEIGGGYKNRLEQYESILNDISSSAGITLVLLLLVIFAFYRRLWSLPFIFVPLVFGIAWSLGLTFLVYDSLNLITAFIFAILLGLGIDFGIHLLSRYFEERNRGLSALQAMTTVMQTTGVATVTTALTTAVTFYSLLFTSFKGFSQFGFIAGSGVLLCLLAMYTVFPALIFLVERVFKLHFYGHGDAPEGMPNSIGRALFERNGFPFGGAIALGYLGILALSIWLLPDMKFEYDFRNLRSRNPALEKINKKKSGTTAGLTVSPTIAVGSKPDQAPKIARLLRERRNQTRPYRRIDQFLNRAWKWGEWHNPLDKVLAETATPPKTISRYDRLKAIAGYADLIPKDQVAKLAIIRKIHKLIYRKIDFIPKKHHKAVRHLQEAASITAPITEASLPPLFRRAFREPNRDARGQLLLANGKPTYSYGGMVYIFPDGSMFDGLNATKYAAQVAGLTVDGERIRFAGSALIFADVIKLMRVDSRKALTISLMVVLFTLLLSFAAEDRRNLKIFLTNHIGSFGVLLLLNRVFHFGLSGETCLLYSMGVSILVDLLTFPRVVARTTIVLVPLLASLLIVTGLMVIFNIKVSFFNMIVFPMITGVGIDNGIHVFHRYEEEREGSLIYVLRHTGVAVGMATFTTMIGFSGMLFANHMGLRGIGVLALLGLGLCLFVALTLLPALLSLLERFDLLKYVRDGEH